MSFRGTMPALVKSNESSLAEGTRLELGKIVWPSLRKKARKEERRSAARIGLEAEGRKASGDEE